MPKESLVSQFFVAGLVYSDYANVKLKRGQRISLVKEPTNPHDQWAIRVLVKGVKIGFVPRERTRDFHSFVGKSPRANIHAYEPVHSTHRRVLVNVYGVAATQEETNVIC